MYIAAVGHLLPELPASYGSPLDVFPVCPEIGSLPDWFDWALLLLESPQMARLAALAALLIVSIFMLWICQIGLGKMYNEIKGRSNKKFCKTLIL
jgi:hypothetical protein